MSTATNSVSSRLVSAAKTKGGGGETAGIYGTLLPGSEGSSVDRIAFVSLRGIGITQDHFEDLSCTCV